MGAALSLLPAAASAHAVVVSLDPGAALLAKPPRLVTITFSEPVTPFGRGVDVLSPSGRLVSGRLSSQGAVLSVPVTSNEKGTYLVEWRVVAQDTHPSRGTYTFSVGHSSPPPAGLTVSQSDLGQVAPAGLVLQVLSRWLHFLGFAFAFGGLAFTILVLGLGRPSGRILGLVYAGLGLLVVAEPIALFGQAASLGSVDSPSLADVLGSAFGRVLALRLAAPLLLWGILGALPAARGRGAYAALAVGVALAIVDGLAGHTIRGQPEVWADLLTAVHVGSMALWVGGLAALVLVLPLAGDRRLELVRRFGRVAAISVAVLIASGAVLALVHLQAPLDLLFTAYGMALAVKLVAVGLALFTAWLGLRVARSAWPEAVALAGVVGLASLLASLPPVR